MMDLRSYIKGNDIDGHIHLKNNQLDLSRVILGSDQNRLSKKENINSKFDEGFCYINSDRNIKRLFNI